MKPLRTTLLAVACVQGALFSPTSVAQRVEVIERGPHHAVVQTILPDGTTNQFTQLQTGLNRWSEADRQYVPTSDEVELVNGVPLARKTQYQVIFSYPSTTEDSDLCGGPAADLRR